MIGAAAGSVHVMSTSIWTWVTSLVIRVISDGAPKWATSWAEKSVTWWNSELRGRPDRMPMAAFDPKYDGADREHHLHGGDREHDRADAARCSRCRR